MEIAEHVSFLGTLRSGIEGDSSSLVDDVAGLPAFLRALLVADGTVTVLLRAYFSEAVEVRTKQQLSFRLDAPVPALRLGAGDEGFVREVALTGADSAHEYASAVSVLNPQALDPVLFEALIEENVGMGEVLRNSARGSYREVLDIRHRGKGVERTYVVCLEGRPAIMISECFDPALF